MPFAPAKIELHNLTSADGSALYAAPRGTHILQSAIHYPLEVPFRSDEVPTNTYIEVSIRPHNGVAMVKERHLEEIVRRVLKSVVLGEETPRCMLQVTIQVMEVEADESLPGGVKTGGQAEGYLDLLVGAVNSSVAGCLDGGVQMKGLVGAVLVGLTQEREIKISPDVRQRKQCQSLHAFAYSSKGECVMMESEGRFHMDDWAVAENAARTSVCGAKTTATASNGDTNMDGGDEAERCLFETMRHSVEERARKDGRWKQ